jgi:hypothetical protein
MVAPDAPGRSDSSAARYADRGGRCPATQKIQKKLYIEGIDAPQRIHTHENRYGGISMCMGLLHWWKPVTMVPDCWHRRQHAAPGYILSITHLMARQRAEVAACQPRTAYSPAAEGLPPAALASGDLAAVAASVHDAWAGGAGAGVAQQQAGVAATGVPPAAAVAAGVGGAPRVKGGIHLVAAEAAVLRGGNASACVWGERGR